MILKQWPNKLGYDFGKWEIVNRINFPKLSDKWQATYKPDCGKWKSGTGETFRDAIKNAKTYVPGLVGEWY